MCITARKAAPMVCRAPRAASIAGTSEGQCHGTTEIDHCPRPLTTNLDRLALQTVWGARRVGRRAPADSARDTRRHAGATRPVAGMRMSGAGYNRLESSRPRLESSWPLMMISVYVTSRWANAWLRLFSPPPYLHVAHEQTNRGSHASLKMRAATQATAPQQPRVGSPRLACRTTSRSRNVGCRRGQAMPHRHIILPT